MALKISDAEWEVMNVLWQRSPATARRIIEALEPEHDWHPKTVRTLLSRLVKKGAVTFERDGHRYLYRPAVERAECVEQAGRSFVERVFGGDRSSLLLHFARDTKLTAAEAAELRRLLDAVPEEDS